MTGAEVTFSLSANGVDDTSPSQKSSEQSDKIAACKSKLKEAFDLSSNNLDNQSDMYIPAVEQLCQTIFNSHSKSDSARCSNLILTKRLMKTGRNINVQPTAVQSRTTHLGGRKLQQTGRPPKEACAGTEHAYSHVARPSGGSMCPVPPKPRGKMAHSISERVEAMRYGDLPQHKPKPRLSLKRQYLRVMTEDSGAKKRRDD